MYSMNKSSVERNVYRFDTNNCYKYKKFVNIQTHLYNDFCKVYEELKLFKINVLYLELENNKRPDSGQEQENYYENITRRTSALHS